LVALGLMIGGIVPGNRPDHNSPCAQELQRIPVSRYNRRT
jgi:hypothetical protein